MQPAGDEVNTVLVCVLLAWQAPQAEYVNEVQVVTGGTYVQDCVSTGVPVQPDGVDDSSDLVCVPVERQVPHGP